MKHTSLRRHLLAVGRAAGRHAEAGRVRLVALFCAALVITCGLTTLAAVHAVYAGRQDRIEARAPVPQELQPSRHATVLWDHTVDTLPDHRQFDIVYLTPLTEDAPPPPGVVTWPEPGQVLLSPALREAGKPEGIEERYGHTVGVIGQQGLADPSERLAYIRPRHDLSADRAEALLGFGPEAGTIAPGLAFGGEDAKPEGLFDVLVAGMLLLPGAALLFVAARAGAHGRDRRTALIAALGGRRGDRALIAVGEARTPVICGAAVAAALSTAAMATTVHLPVTGYVVSAADLRHSAWLLYLVALVSVVLVLGMVVLTDQLPRRRNSTRPVGARRPATWWGALCPFLLLITVRGPELLFPPASPGYIITYWAGAAGTLLTLPAAIAACTAALGRLLARGGRARRRAGALVSGRRVSAHPGPVARMVTGVAIGLALLMQVIAWQGIFGSQAQAAQATIDRIGRSVAYVSAGSEVTQPEVSAFLHRIPGSTRVLVLRDDHGTLTFQGSCDDLRALSLPCPRGSAQLRQVPVDARVRELIKWNRTLSGRVDVAQGHTPAAVIAGSKGEETKLVLVADDGKDLPIPTLKRLSYRTFPEGAAVDVPGASWLIGGTPNRDQARWSVLFGGLGIAVLAAAAGLAGMAEFLRHGRALAPLSVLTGGHRVFRTSAAWSVFLPLGLAGVLGAAVGVLLAGPVVHAGAPPISATTLTGCAVVVIALGLVMWVWAASTAVRQAVAWRPGGD